MTIIIIIIIIILWILTNRSSYVWRQYTSVWSEYNGYVNPFMYKWSLTWFSHNILTLGQFKATIYKQTIREQVRGRLNTTLLYYSVQLNREIWRIFGICISHIGLSNQDTPLMNTKMVNRKTNKNKKTKTKTNKQTDWPPVVNVTFKYL